MAYGSKPLYLIQLTYIFNVQSFLDRRERDDVGWKPFMFQLLFMTCPNIPGGDADEVVSNKNSYNKPFSDIGGGNIDDELLLNA